MTEEIIYVVTDGEFDGPVPGRNSMLSFASVAINGDGKKFGEFEAVLEPLPNAAPHPETTAFWKTEPAAYAAATQNPEAPALVMQRFTTWVRALPGLPIFVSHPAALDGAWIDFYLQKFTNDFLLEGPWKPDRLFKAAPLCLASFMMGRTGRSVFDYGNYPSEWLGHIEHTHRAIDDARGYANMLVYLIKQGIK